MRRRLGAARDHHVGAAADDHLERRGDGLGPGRARRDGGVSACPRPDLELHVRGGGVGHEHGNRQGKDARRALLLDGVPRVEERPHPADPGGDGGAEAIGVDLGRASVGPRLPRRDDRHLRRGVHALHFRAREDLLGLDRDLTREGDLEPVLLDPVVVERTDARAAVKRGLPGGWDISAQGRGHPESGNDNLGHGFSERWWGTCVCLPRTGARPAPR